VTKGPLTGDPRLRGPLTASHRSGRRPRAVDSPPPSDFTAGQVSVRPEVGGWATWRRLRPSALAW
jgi:hypothetical protein